MPGQQVPNSGMCSSRDQGSPHHQDKAIRLQKHNAQHTGYRPGCATSVGMRSLMGTLLDHLPSVRCRAGQTYQDVQDAQQLLCSSPLVTVSFWVIS